MIHLKNLSKSFNSLSVLRDVNLDIPQGKFLTLLGPSGCGKSTLLRIIAGLELPSTGERVLKKEPLNLSYVFQDPELLSWRNLEENILLPLELAHKSTNNQQLDEILNLVKLEKFRKYYPHQLSGGMKMRTSLARALITSPEMILMDEPFSALDEMTRFELQEQLTHLCKLKKMTVVFVTHSISEAVYLSDQVEVLSLSKKSQIFNLAINIENKDKFRHSQLYNDYVTQLSLQIRNTNNNQNSSFEVVT